MTPPQKVKILAVASGGGHWIQLLRIRPAFDGATVVYASSDSPSNMRKLGARFHVLRDANRNTKLSLLLCAFRMFVIVLRERPDVVISTGAAPGYFAVLFGNWIGARTIWIDSIANAEEISYSGKLARSHSSYFLTQWESLANANGVRFEGSVL